MAEDAIAELEQLQNQTLSIIKLSEPFIYPSDGAPNGVRNSDASNATADQSAQAMDTMTPDSLEADLAHYKDLFSKLRFSYLEQVTKEKFLRAIVGDPPLIVEAHENSALEADLAEVKGSLKAQKVEVATLVEELEKKGMELGQRHQTLASQIPLLSTLPSTLSTMRETNAKLREILYPDSSAPSGSVQFNQLLSLSSTQSLLSEKQVELDALNAELEMLRSALPRETAKLERLKKEMVPLEAKRETSVRAAENARRKKVEGEGDGGDERGRWLRACESGIQGMLGVEA
ncbi:MAG: hypothetical protein M4579_003476 [Chaenotheca gracillima]|nr:MAG: hypothetical protein M4579_003476 [Chaenotheca gracillima]